jgi:hypothetical protein
MFPICRRLTKESSSRFFTSRLGTIREGSVYGFCVEQAKEESENLEMVFGISGVLIVGAVAGGVYLAE